MPGSGFAQTFIGMDVVIVMILIAARAGSRASGAASASSSSTRSTPSACAARRSAAARARPAPIPQSIHDLAFFGPTGALNPTGDLVLETRAVARAGCSPRAPSRARYPPAIRRDAIQNFMFPGG